jgi:hypothetical protein
LLVAGAEPPDVVELALAGRVTTTGPEQPAKRS